MNDRMTKILLLAIALGLWANALVPLIRPTAAAAQNRSDTVLLSIDRHLNNIESDVSSIRSDVSSIETDASTIKGDVSSIGDGTCTNDHLCP